MRADAVEAEGVAGASDDKKPVVPPQPAIWHFPVMGDLFREASEGKRLEARADIRPRFRGPILLHRLSSIIRL
jgi:hypothetical protein